MRQMREDVNQGRAQKGCLGAATVNCDIKKSESLSLSLSYSPREGHNSYLFLIIIPAPPMSPSFHAVTHSPSLLYFIFLLSHFLFLFIIIKLILFMLHCRLPALVSYPYPRRFYPLSNFNLPSTVSHIRACCLFSNNYKQTKHPPPLSLSLPLFSSLLFGYVF